MIPGKTFEDEIPDSIFRTMFRKNALTLFILALISISSALFFYFKVLDHKYKLVEKINLKHSGQIIVADSKAHQRMIRLLKSEEVRMKVVTENHLIERYAIDSTEKYFAIQLDKFLYDNLKVEEQLDGTIQVKFKDKDASVAKDVIEDLNKYAMMELYKFTEQDDIELNVVSSELVSEKKEGHPKAFSLVILITAPVLLVFVLFIAIKEKLLISLVNND